MKWEGIYDYARQNHIGVEMAKKIKVIIKNERFKFNLPALPLWTISTTVKFLVKRIEDDELRNLIKENENWRIKDLGIVLIASILPFGTFYVDWKYLKK